MTRRTGPGTVGAAENQSEIARLKGLCQTLKRSVRSLVQVVCVRNQLCENELAQRSGVCSPKPAAQHIVLELVHRQPPERRRIVEHLSNHASSVGIALLLHLDDRKATGLVEEQEVGLP